MAVDIKGIFDNLKKAEENDTKSMTEGAFKELFLPMFLNQESNPHSLTLANWTEFAGGPFRSVKVTDNAGALLFTVPPIYNRKALDELGAVDAGGRPLMSVSHVMTTYGQMARMGPIVGENYINKELEKRFAVMKQDVDYIATLKVWQQIFIRYGHSHVIPLELGNDTGGAPKQIKESDHQDEIISDF